MPDIDSSVVRKPDEVGVFCQKFTTLPIGSCDTAANIRIVGNVPSQMEFRVTSDGKRDTIHGERATIWVKKADWDAHERKEMRSILKGLSIKAVLVSLAIGIVIAFATYVIGDITNRGFSPIKAFLWGAGISAVIATICILAIWHRMKNPSPF